MLKILPPLTLPIVKAQFHPYMDSVVQLNILDAGITENMQRGLGIYLHIFDLYVKTKGKIDYRGKAGHERLKQDAQTFCGTGNPVATRHGDLAAFHLGIDWSDTAIRCLQFGIPELSPDPHFIVNDSVDLHGLSAEDAKRIGIILDALGKKVL